MEIWHTWLAYFGLIFGLGASGIFRGSPGRSALIGLAAGGVLVALWNVAAPGTAPCLQSSKGWDQILRAYSLNCSR